MKMSGRVKIPDNEVQTKDTPSEIDDATCQLLTSAYRKLIPRFDELVEEYTREQQRKTTAVPPFCKWTPKELHESDSLLLQGPGNIIYVYKKLVFEHQHTGRLITYAPADKLSKYALCYVQVFSIGHTSRPVFGEIKLCFLHTFKETRRKFVLLDIYSTHLYQDTSTKLWWLPLHHEGKDTEQIICEVSSSSLSSPLFTARDEGKLWFLDSHSAN